MKKEKNIGFASFVHWKLFWGLMQLSSLDVKIQVVKDQKIFLCSISLEVSFICDKQKNLQNLQTDGK